MVGDAWLQRRAVPAANSRKNIEKTEEGRKAKRAQEKAERQNTATVPSQKRDLAGRSLVLLESHSLTCADPLILSVGNLKHLKKATAKAQELREMKRVVEL